MNLKWISRTRSDRDQQGNIKTTKQPLTERSWEVDLAPLRATQEGGSLVNLGSHVERSDSLAHHHDWVDFHVHKVEVDVQLEQRRQEIGKHVLPVCWHLHHGHGTNNHRG